MEKRVLGKGLEALIPKKAIRPATQPQTSAPTQEKEYVYIDIANLKPSAYQSRLDLPQRQLKELAESIKNQGVIQPLIVRKKGDYFEIAQMFKVSSKKNL